LLAALSLDFDFFSRIKFATLNETPPRTKPIAVAGRAWVTLNGSTNIEKVSVAINTPLPNAIIVVIMFFDKLANRETTQPISKGLPAIKPKNNDSSMPWEVVILNNHLSRVSGTMSAFVFHLQKGF
jgi:hypothetical protein